MAAVALLDALAVPIVLDDAVFFQRGRFDGGGRR
jgi:hypothetical protein